MHISSIKQNAQSIIDAYETYTKAALAPKKDSKKLARLKKYILNLSEDISKKAEELKLDVR
ncbi:hypothetical protein HOF78_00090 [Candidatus Woesearchaeota archaeon]|jgi:hypothetical protein|nr:hypothetical protein [Candidatus Woesearchaeota archaeon]